MWRVTSYKMYLPSPLVENEMNNSRVDLDYVYKVWSKLGVDYSPYPANLSLVLPDRTTRCCSDK